MSYQLTAWVQNNTPKARGIDKCVLYALAHRIPYGQKHWTCFADELSAWTGIPKRTLRDCCARLSEDGYLLKKGKGGRRKDGSGIPITYSLVGAPVGDHQVGENHHVTNDKVADIAELVGDLGGETCQQEPGKSRQQEGGKRCHQKTIKQSEKEYTPDDTMGFSEFYEKYPRRGDREATKEAYQALLADGQSHSDLMAALERYRDENSENIKNGKHQYLKYSNSWLTERYFDRYQGSTNSRAAKQEAILRQRAEAIRKGQSWVSRHVSTDSAQAMVERGMVTEAECIAIGLYLRQCE